MTIRTRMTEGLFMMTDILCEPFFLRAALACLLTALPAGFLGSLMIWRKTAYFGEALSHGALAGVFLGFLCGVSVNIGVGIFVFFLSFVLYKALQAKHMETDLFLLIIGQTALCIGWVLLSVHDDIRSDLTAYLFGDVLSVSGEDLVFMAFVCAVCSFLLKKNWKKQVFVAVSHDMAQSEGIDVSKQTLVLMTVTALFVTTAFKTTGILLASALLIIPPCAASLIAKTPERNAFLAGFLGVLCVFAGLFSSLFFDIPAAPAMEIWCAVVFLVLFVSKTAISKKIFNFVFRKTNG